MGAPPSERDGPSDWLLRTDPSGARLAVKGGVSGTGAEQSPDGSGGTGRDGTGRAGGMGWVESRPQQEEPI